MTAYELGQKYKVISEERTGKANGTCLQGYMKTDYNTLVNLFGFPNSGSDDGKTTAEWLLEYSDGTIVTIYDWKTGSTPKSEYDWHVGGKSEKALELLEFTANIPTRSWR